MEWLIIGWVGIMLAFGLGGYELSQRDRYSKARAVLFFFAGQAFFPVFIAGVVAVSKHQ